MAIQSAFNFDEEGVLERQFWVFHLNHPEVYTALVYFAKQWRERRGPDAHCGIKALYERARWEIWLDLSNDPPKLSNNHTAFYARLIMQRNPDLEEIFRLKRQKVQATFGPDNQLLEPDDYVE